MWSPLQLAFCGLPYTRMYKIPFGSWDAQIKNGNPGNGRKSRCFHNSETLGYLFLLFERGQEENWVCVSLERGQAFLIIYQDSHDIVCMEVYLNSGKKSCKVISSFLGFL